MSNIAIDEEEAESSELPNWYIGAAVTPLAGIIPLWLGGLANHCPKVDLTVGASPRASVRHQQIRSWPLELDIPPKFLRSLNSATPRICMSTQYPCRTTPKHTASAALGKQDKLSKAYSSARASTTGWSCRSADRARSAVRAGKLLLSVLRVGCMLYRSELLRKGGSSEVGLEVA